MARFSPRAAGCIFHPEAGTQGTASTILARFIMGAIDSAERPDHARHPRTAQARTSLGVHQRAEDAGRPRPGTPVQLVDHRGRGRLGLADDGPIAVRVLGDTRAGACAHSQTPVAAADARPNLIPADTNAYRVVNGEGDGLGGLIVDRYDDTMVLRLYSAAWVPHLDAIVSCLQDRPETVTVPDATVSDE